MDRRVVVDDENPLVPFELTFSVRVVCGVHSAA
jgi:hypothetical protein